LLKRKFDLQFGGRLRIQSVPGDSADSDEQQDWSYRNHAHLHRQSVGNIIHYDVGVRVTKHQFAPQNTVFKALRKVRKIH